MSDFILNSPDRHGSLPIPPIDFFACGHWPLDESSRSLGEG